jgi:glycosyltransferase involved in cell wall biosynthesis
MRIIQINSVYKTGSTGQIVEYIHKLLVERNYESYVAFGRGKHDKQKYLIRIGNQIDLYLHGIITRIFDKHGFGSYKSTVNFLKMVESIQPSLIHLHNLHGYYINVQILFDFIKKKKIPIVWTLHDCWGFTGHCCYFDYVSCQKWKTACFKCPTKKRYPASFFIDGSKKNYERKKRLFTGVNKLKIVVPSRWLFNLIKDSFLNEYEIEVIYNGIDLDSFMPTRNEFRKKNLLFDKFIILGVANIWTDRKGVQYFLELSKYIQKDEIIVLVGLNKKELKKLPNNIIGIEKTFNLHELIDIYSSADVFVNPTLEDNFPTTNIEALACGTPVITFDTGGSPEAIHQGGGLIVKNKSAKALYEAIEYIKNNIKEFSAETCRDIAVKKFDYKINYLRYLDIYKELIN